MVVDKNYNEADLGVEPDLDVVRVLLTPTGGYGSNETSNNASSSSPMQEGTSSTAAWARIPQRIPQLRGDPKFDQLWVVSLLYLFHGLGSATWGRFSCIYYLTKGLSTFQIGIIEGLMPVMKMFCGPLWGYLADLTRTKKYVYLFCRFTSSAILCLLAFPKIANGFTSILILSIINVSFVAMGILEAYAIEICGNQKQKLYGRVRLWQSIAAGVGAITMGYITDMLGFTANFIGWGFMAILNCSLIAWKVPNRTETEQTYIEEGRKMKCLDFLTVVWKELWFFLLIIVFGMGIGVIDKLLFVYLTTELQASTSFCGLTVMVTVIIEIPLFHYGQKLLHFFGRNNMFTLALTAYIVRVFGYTVLKPGTKYWILPLEILHGIGFSNVWMVSIDYSSDIVPPGWNSTMQTFLRSLYLSVGAGIGAVGGGYIMEHFGAKHMYTIYGLVCCAFLVFHIIFITTGVHSFNDVHERYDFSSYDLVPSEEEEDAGSTHNDFLAAAKDKNLYNHRHYEEENKGCPSGFHSSQQYPDLSRIDEVDRAGRIEDEPTYQTVGTSPQKAHR